jgi:putative ABC transport system permease protein
MLHDIRYGIRTLLRNSGVTAIALFALAIGIGAASALYSIVDAVLFRSIAIDEPERVVMIWENDLARGHGEVEVSYPDFEDWRRSSHLFSEMAVLPSVNLEMTLTGDGAEPQQVQVTSVTERFFPLLGVRAGLGRLLLPADYHADAAPVAVISSRLWRERFGSSAGAVGRSIVIEGQPLTIIGVMPSAFDFPKDIDVWTPLAQADSGWTRSRGARVLMGIGRLKPDVSIESASREMNDIAQGLASAYPAENKGLGITLIPLLDTIFGNTRIALAVLSVAVVVVLLIACVNVANLLLARGLARRRELAVRMALGSSRGRLVRQLLTESLLLALASGTCGVVLASFGLDLLMVLAPADIPRISQVEVDGGVVAFALAVSCATAFIFGVAPALDSSGFDLNETLKGGAARSGTPRHRRLRGLLVVGEIALAVVLMVGAGLLAQSFGALSRIDPGFDPAHVLTVRVPLVKSRYADRASQLAFFESLRGRLAAVPGVESVAAVLMRPLSGTVGWDSPFTVEGESRERKGGNSYSNYEAISPGYFRTMEIPLVEGRDFTDADRKGSEGVAIVSRTMARRYWPGRSAVGGRLKFGDPDSPAPWLTVVGVAGDVRYREWDTARPDIYIPYLQRCEYRSDFVIRTAPDPMSLAGAVRREVYAIDKEQAVTGVTTMERLVDGALARPRFNTLLMAIFAALALLLAALGVYGVMAHAVSQQTREIGIRVALGAPARSVMRLIIARGMALAGIGLLLGLAGAAAAGRLLSGLLFGVGPADPATYAAAGGVLLVVSLLACWIPARRVLGVDPVVALRHE